MKINKSDASRFGIAWKVLQKASEGTRKHWKALRFVKYTVQVERCSIRENQKTPSNEMKPVEKVDEDRRH